MTDAIQSIMENWTEIAVSLVVVGSTLLLLSWKEDSDPFGRGQDLYILGWLFLIPGAAGLFARWPA